MIRSSRLCYYLAGMTIVASLFAYPMPLHAQNVPPGYEKAAFSFSFPGGTLKDYVKVLKENSPAIQVIVAPEIEGLKMRAVEFKGVSPNAVLAVIPQLVQGHVEIQSSVRGGGGFGGRENVIWRISPPPYTTRVFSVLHFLTGKSVDDAMKALISAIEATLEIGSNSTPEVKIKLHADTGLLLVAGTQEQIKIVEQVVSQLPRKDEATGKTLEDLFTQVTVLEKELNKLRLELEQRREGGAKN